MKLIVIAITCIALFCGRGPSEDRAKRNCETNRLMLYLVLADSNLSEGFKKVTLIQAFLECNEEPNDSTIDRYYRGYVEGKD